MLEMTRTSQPMRALFCGATLIGLMVGMKSIAAAQATDAPPTGAAITNDAMPPADSTPTGRFPLLREGSTLVGVVGNVDRDPVTGGRRLTISVDDERSPGHQLVFLPNTLLTELDQVIAFADADSVLQFRITGRVMIYEGRNFLVMTHPPILIGRGVAPLATPEPSVPAANAPAATTTSATTSENDTDPDDIDSIMSRLERAVGPVARRPGAAASTADGNAPAADATNTQGAATGRTIAEGTRIVDRRARVRRTTGGGYSLIFDADASGISDPPMMLLPCRLLEDLAAVSARRAEDASVLISGEVMLYRGRNYLLPSVYRIPSNVTALTPGG